jgi:hypothetical protein
MLGLSCLNTLVAYGAYGALAEALHHAGATTVAGAFVVTVGSALSASK